MYFISIILTISIINNNTQRSRLNLINSVSYDGQTCNACDIKGHSVWCTSQYFIHQQYSSMIALPFILMNNNEVLGKGCSKA